MSEVKSHFEEIAKYYDYYKGKNSYYYSNLKQLLKLLIKNSENKTILDLGCGTGDLLAHLNPKEGLGVDISRNMVKIAKKKYPNLNFLVGAVEEFKTIQKFDYFILVDVIEHLEDIERTISNLSSICGKKTKIIISMANPHWEIILYILELLKLKMPEGPHNRISYRKFKETLLKKNLYIEKRGKRLIIPVKIPLLDRLNDIFYKIPLIWKLGLIEWYVIKRI